MACQARRKLVDDTLQCLSLKTHHVDSTATVRQDHIRDRSGNDARRSSSNIASRHVRTQLAGAVRHERPNDAQTRVTRTLHKVPVM